MFFERMTSQEVDALDRGKTLAVYCISPTGQHSLHLPMGTDYFIGTELVRRMESVSPSPFLCLPTVWFAAAWIPLTASSSADIEGFEGVITVVCIDSWVCQDTSGATQRRFFGS